MGSISDFSELALINHVLNTAYTPASTIYLALCTADPTDAGTGASMNEVANSGSYARTAIAFSAAASRRSTQNGVVTFPKSTSAWGTVTHWAIVDSATYGAGNLLAAGSFSASKQIVSNNTPSVADTDVYVEFNAGFISNYLANKLLDLMFRNTAYSKPSTYIALTTATIADSNTGSTITEPSGNGYARKQVNINGGSSPVWTLAASGSANNSDAITFATASGSWGTIVAACIVDASSTGNLLFYDNSVTDQAVGTNDIWQFDAGAFVVNMS